jgi:hypothetical protein
MKYIYVPALFAVVLDLKFSTGKSYDEIRLDVESMPENDDADRFYKLEMIRAIDWLQS